MTDYQLTFGWGEMTPKGFEVKKEPTLKEWGKAWAKVTGRRRLDKWARGCLLYIAESTEGLGEDIFQFIKNVDVSEGTLANEKSVAKAYWSDWQFIDQVSWSHHEVVAKLDPARRRYWLQQAVDTDMTVKELREATAEERGTEAEAGSLAHKQTVLERLKNGRDKVDAAFGDMEEGPWIDLVRSGLNDIDEAIEVYQDNLHAEPVGAPPLQQEMAVA